MSIIIMILLLSFLILIHEAGHLLAALAFKMKVERFGFGLPIGPTLYQTEWKGIKILVHACLLGGYISFPDDESDCELAQDSPERFSNKPIYQRMIVISAGIIANILIAVVLVLFSALVADKFPSGKYNIFIDDIQGAKSHVMRDLGIKNGDKIVSINNVNINNELSIYYMFNLSRAYDSKVNAERIDDYYKELKSLNPAFSKNEIIQKDVVIRLPEHRVEETVYIDKYVAKGIKIFKDNQITLSNDIQKLRDEIKDKRYYLSDGTKTLENIAEAVSDSYHPINMVIERDGKQINLPEFCLPEKESLTLKIKSERLYVENDSLLSAVKAGFGYIYDNTVSLVYGLWQMLTGNVPLKYMHGIIVITKIGGDVIAQEGFLYGVLLAAVISIDLAIINFLPIPALDGGHFMFLLIEKITGRKIKEEFIEKISNVCFFLLLAFMVVVIFNDIFALVMQKI